MKSSTFFMVCVEFLLLTSPATAAIKQKRRKANFGVTEKKRECAAVKCRHLVTLESQNCVNECISPQCYRKTFAEPLEDGEVNTVLTTAFTRCAQREARAAISNKTSRRRSKDVGKPMDTSASVGTDTGSQRAEGSPLYSSDVSSPDNQEAEGDGDSGDHDDDVELDGEEYEPDADGWIGDTNAHAVQ